MTQQNAITIDGERFIREGSIEAPRQDGPLTILVLTAGWIFVGQWDGKTLTAAQNVRYFKKVGFGGLTQGAKHAEAILDECRDVTPSQSAILFTAPLPQGWENA